MAEHDIKTYIKSFIPFVKFLAEILGPSSEVVLNDVTDLEHSVIYIKNANITNRKIGDPASDLALRTIKAGNKEHRDYIANYYGRSENNKLRSSTYFIRYAGKIVAMICVNTDQSSLENLTKQLEIVNRNFNLPTVPLGEIANNIYSSNKSAEYFNKSNENLLHDVISDKCAELNITINYLKKHDKIQIIKTLYNDGYFLLKDSVPKVAKSLNASIPTVYRYLNQVKKKEL